CRALPALSSASTASADGGGASAPNARRPAATSEVASIHLTGVSSRNAHQYSLTPNRRFSYFAPPGTRRFNSSNQLSTTWICRAGSTMEGFRMRKCWPSGVTAYIGAVTSILQDFASKRERGG